MGVFALSIACLGFCIVVIKDTKIKYIRFLLLLIFIIFSLLTIQRNFIYSSEIDFWNDIVIKSPQKARPFNGRGVAYMNAGDIDSAMEDFKEALRLRPMYTTALYNIAKCHIANENYSEAIDFLIKALEAPYTEIPKGQIQLTIGIVYLRLQQPDRALKYFNTALDVNPDLYNVYYYRALVFAEQGDYPKALEQLNIFLRYTWAIEYINLRGIYYFNARMYDDALRDFNTVLKNVPNDAGIYCNISDVYLMKNDVQNALGALEKAIQIDPELAEAHEKKKVLLEEARKEPTDKME
jgi:tetratricopeptide (TPR) repeat protein